MPIRFKTPAKVARFKRAQREFDRVILDMGLARRGLNPGSQLHRVVFSGHQAN
jgi:hypothetical protein